MWKIPNDPAWTSGSSALSQQKNAAIENSLGAEVWNINSLTKLDMFLIQNFAVNPEEAHKGSSEFQLRADIN